MGSAVGRLSISRFIILSARTALVPFLLLSRCCDHRSTPLRAVRKAALQDTIIVADITDTALEAGE
jgi:hypothetical protein